MDARDAGILAQVAFKEACETARREQVDITTDDGFNRLEALYFKYEEALVAAVVGLQGSQAPTPPPSARTTEGRPVANFDDPAPMGDCPIEVRGAKGPIPQWLIDQALAKGVTAVWDNRGEFSKSGKPMPAFKEVVPRGSTKKPEVFWPPRGGEQ